ncbi:MAG: MBL fold metallo-hydrolase [Candidatus Zixiibacteriota bacterium]|nr:MAG: MBL fold metallo-hydrolase [candidate division Zixibacteria bacterium]
MKLQTLVVGLFEVNCFLYWDESTGDGVVIDPGDEGERIIEAVERAGFVPQAILLTHGHGDHIVAVGEIKEKFQIPIYIGAGEEKLLANPSANVSALIGHPIVAPPPDYLVTDEQMLTFGSFTLRVLSTPGHTPAGVCYLDETEGRLFCGDTLFYGSIGRTDFPGSSHEQLINSIKTKILTLPDSIVCYPGHGPETTVGGERVNNPFLTGGFMV